MRQRESRKTLKTGEEKLMTMRSLMGIRDTANTQLNPIVEVKKPWRMSSNRVLRSLTQQLICPKF